VLLLLLSLPHGCHRCHSASVQLLLLPVAYTAAMTVAVATATTAVDGSYHSSIAGSAVFDAATAANPFRLLHN
jgi:hypothetical protein